MNKEEIEELLDKLDRDEWCTDLYEVPLTWCELYDIRDYINSLEQENKQLKEILNKIKNIDIFKEFSFPLMKRWEEQQVLSSIDYQFKTTFIKKINELEKGEQNE